MRFIADENVDRLLVRTLRARGHTVVYVAEEGMGLADSSVLAAARRNDAVLITEDKGFGELLVARGLSCKGVVLLRLNELSRDEAIAIASSAIGQLSERASAPPRNARHIQGVPPMWP